MTIAAQQTPLLIRTASSFTGLIALTVLLSDPPKAIAADPLPSPAAAIRVRISADDTHWLREATRGQLQGCRIEGAGGVQMHTPDGSRFYRALWVRDFAYMVEYAGDLLDPREIKASILYLLQGQRGDGCIPDRVNAAGKPVYGPGPEKNQFAEYALDNNMFIAKLVCSYVRLSGDLDFFRAVEPKIRLALDHTPRAANGLVYNSPENPVIPYGFTDCILKTGHLLFCSVLYFEACREMAYWSRLTGSGDARDYHHRAEQVRSSLSLLWDEKTGMFWAADADCKQTDIWGSALAAETGCATDVQATRIADYLIENYDTLVEHGQVRHLPAGQFWQRLVPRLGERGVPAGTYQNGAFWGTPIAWVAPTIARRNPDLAVRMVNDAIADYRAKGIMECINGDYRKLPNYVVSATNVYGLVKPTP